MKNVLLIIASCFSLLFCNGLNCCFSKEQDNVLVCKPTDGDMRCYICSQKSEYQKSEPQRRNYLTIKEYENKDYINIRNVRLPEYELRDSSMADLISRFINNIMIRMGTYYFVRRLRPSGLLCQYFLICTRFLIMARMMV